MMVIRPTEIRLTIAPDRRLETIDVNARIAREAGDVLRRHRRALYCSPHTTAGYLERDTSARLRHSRDRVARFLGEFGGVFPEGADYRHDRMELRTELTDAQKKVEPRNADSHLTYISAGVRNCVSYRTSDRAVYFIDLDGTSAAMRRRRETSIVGYDDERVVALTSVAVPAAAGAFDAVNLADPSLGLLARVQELVSRSGIEHGRVDFALGPRQRGAALTVNEYETLLMRHDLMDALRSPMRFARMSRGLARSRRLSLPAGSGRLVRGTHQSPILLQWRPARGEQRRVDIAVVELSCQPVSSMVTVSCPIQTCP
jgi:thiamine phosphate synthase YjbQ (UPF0047 family)